MNAVEDEEQDFDDEEVDEESEELPEPPKRYNVSSYGWDSDVEGLVKRLKRGDIYIPGFQRGFVWNGPEKSRFIESLILGLPVPNVFLAQDAKSKSLNIVDGQQASPGDLPQGVEEFANRGVFGGSTLGRDPSKGGGRVR